MSPQQHLSTILAKHDYKLTKPRMAVFTALLHTGKPLTTSALAAQLCDTVDKVTVYRTIALFEKTGIVHRLWSGFKSSVELSEQFSPHHHHFTCLGCQQVSVFDDPGIEASLHALETKMSIQLQQHQIELQGYCQNCR